MGSFFSHLTPYLCDHPKVGANSPGALDGTGLFQTLAALKLREYYESVTGKKVLLRTTYVVHEWTC